ncbi:hypothetical protein AWB80_02987 [Caballeronia pedi]|uniref:Uncharacterized protein n=1 Tax=Caballeronia pedi TaxID=1777141 RepID=A0A158B3C7_9BURK|nr:hypothetical protein [Caballeronia pedi]SAK64246.1 hypothetical protein AWB80_02987 [Caballeronia pedi]
MTRQIQRFWVAGIVVFLVGSFASANEQTRLIPFQRVAADWLFFPSPAIVSTAGVHSAKPRHPRYLFKSTIDALDAITLSRYEKSIHPDLGQLARLSPQPPSPTSVPAPMKPRDDLTNGEDEWHFSANPQLGANHEHEKGVTFSVRHDF